MDDLRPVVAHAGNEEELINRYLTVGALFYEEGIYDSALYYLIPVFENTENRLSQIQAAEYLRNVYDSIGELGKADVCARFLADQKKSEGQNKALVSQLEELFKTYMNQKLEQKAEKERQKTIKETVEIIVPIAVVVTLVILIITRIKGRDLLKKQQVEANKVLIEMDKQHEEELRKRQVETEKTLKD